MSVFEDLLSAVADELLDTTLTGAPAAQLVREGMDSTIPQDRASVISVTLGNSLTQYLITNRIDWLTTIEVHCEARKSAQDRSPSHAVAAVLSEVVRRLSVGNAQFMARLSGLAVTAINADDGHGSIERDVALTSDQIGAATYLLVIGHSTGADLTPRT
jgi:predicted component of type VI protein secretion system